MTALLVRLAQTLSARLKRIVPPKINSCAGDCAWEYSCDSNRNYFRRKWCYNSSCVWAPATGWQPYGTC